MVAAGIEEGELVLVRIRPPALAAQRPVRGREPQGLAQDRETAPATLDVGEMVQRAVDRRRRIPRRRATESLEDRVMREIILPNRALDHPILRRSGIPKPGQLVAIGRRLYRESVGRANP